MSEFELVRSKYVLNDIEGVNGCKAYEISTPVVSFKHYLSPRRNGHGLVCISQKNDFNVQAVAKVLDVINSTDQVTCKNAPITILNAQNLGISFFDSVAILNNLSHSQFKGDIPELHSSTLVAFPCHHSEFSPDDSVENLNYVRNKVISTLDWNREISPRVWMWYENYVTSERLNSNDLLIGSVGFLREVIENIIKSGEGIIKLKNNFGEELNILIANSICTIRDKEYSNINEAYDYLLDWFVR